MYLDCLFIKWQHQYPKLMEITTGLSYRFEGKPWQHLAPSSWTFVSLPESISNAIRNNSKTEEEGWGRLKVTAQIGQTKWRTAIWFDTKMNTYLLPLKAEIRKKEIVEINKILLVIIWIQ